MSALFSFIQGWIMTGVTQKVCYQSPEGDLGEDQPHADEIF